MISECNKEVGSVQSLQTVKFICSGFKGTSLPVYLYRCIFDRLCLFILRV